MRFASHVSIAGKYFCLVLCINGPNSDKMNIAMCSNWFDASEDLIIRCHPYQSPLPPISEPRGPRAHGP